MVFGRAKGVGGGAGFSFAHVYSTLGTGAIRDRGTLGGSTGVDAGGRGILGGGVVVTATAPPSEMVQLGLSLCSGDALLLVGGLELEVVGF